MAARAENGASARGLFVVIDGADGCGKTTQARRLCEELRRLGRPEPLHVREPGSTALGEELRGILLGREHELSPQVQSLLFAAARRQTLDELVAPALAAGRDVVCERFHPSTFAYQAVAGGDDEDAVLGLLRAWADEPAPDLVLLLQLAPEEAARRRAGRGGDAADRFEGQGVDFQRRVQAGLERYVARAPEHGLGGRIVQIDAADDEDAVAASVLAEVRLAL